MPCSDGNPNNDFNTGYERAVTDYRRDTERQKHRADTLAQMLCFLLASLTAKDVKKLPLPIKEWWLEHQAFDRERERQAKVNRVRALTFRKKIL